jgi:pSer/pThr/pTyr-binding forkhead associated (FHA) protein
MSGLTDGMAIKLNIRRRDAGAGAPPVAQTFDSPIVTIGSDPAASLHLEDRTVAAEQAIIIGGDEEPPLFINRAEGTLLNGESLAREARRPLSDGDVIYIGPYVIGVESANGFRHDTDVTELVSVEDEETDTDDDELLSPITRETPVPTDEAADTALTTQPTSFAAILDSLRTEEDTFYFQVETATAGRRRVPVEGARLLLGWDKSGQNVACGDEEIVAVPRAVVHKDWSGVMLQPEMIGEALVNGEPVETARRLRNGDRVTLRPVSGSGTNDPARNFFIFYEPTSLVVLDSLLPAQQLPPPVAPPPSVSEGTGADALVPAPASLPAVRPTARAPLMSRTFLRYYTVGEVLLMACATLVGAFVIFLILEYS